MSELYEGNIKVVSGDVLDVEEGIIVHGCNCLGVMGSGIAVAVKNRFPKVYEAYRAIHETPEGLRLGEIIPVRVGENKWIVNAMTQQRTGGIRAVDYEAVARCFEKVNDLAAEILFSQSRVLRFEQFNDIESKTSATVPICFPMIGAGLGGGNWNIIATIIDETINDSFEKKVYVLPAA